MAIFAHHVQDEKLRTAERDRSKDPLNAVRGIMIGCAISAGLWISIVAIVML